jgi:phospholipid/cholesterol/gamma-HCH transport system substrate-binding protein
MGARRLRLTACALLAVLVLGACGGPEETVARAEFDDVVDLATRGAVKIADVEVGVIDDIELTDGHRALVTMAIDPAVELPSRVSARLRKTSVLGERYVELVPDPASGGTFQSGTLISDTVVVPEIEEAIFAGTDVVVAITADTLAGAIQAGAEGLDGRGGTLGRLIADLGDIVSTYDRNSEDLVRLLAGFEQFLAEVGPQAELHGRALQQLSEFTGALDEEDERLLDTLTEIRQLANSGTDIMQTHEQRIDDFFSRFQVISGELTARDADLRRLFVEVSGHNFHTIRGVNREHAQIIADFIVCGLNDIPGDPVRSCEHAPNGRPMPDPRPRQDF